MAAKTLADFQLGDASTIQTNDFIVGYDTATAGGERRWALTTIANAVSGIMNPQLTNSITSATTNIAGSQIANGAVTVAKLGTNEQKQICKAWVNFNGTTSPGTIGSSYNVSSVTRNATGDFTVNFTNAMTNAEYAVAGSCSSGAGTSINTSTATINNLRFYTYGGTGVQTNFIDNSVIIFGN